MDFVVQADKYELEMVIKEGTYASGGSIYVETSISGVINEADKTELVKLEDGVAVWNKHIKKTFASLQPATPIIISLSMYKKKKYLLQRDGYKLIGTAVFSISELIPILNKESVQGRILLNMKKHSPSTSSFLLALRLRSTGTPSPTSSSYKSNRPVSVIYENPLEEEQIDEEEYFES